MPPSNTVTQRYDSDAMASLVVPLQLLENRSRYQRSLEALARLASNASAAP